MEKGRSQVPDVYLEQQEQLIIGAKVNRLCEANPETFDSATQVQDAEDIVTALNSRTRPRGVFSGEASFTSSFSSEVRSGATNARDVNASFDETRTGEFKFGVEEYRIGNYVAIKSTERGKSRPVKVGESRGYNVVKFVREETSQLMFEHFWDRGEVNTVFARNPQLTVIEYDETLDVKSIGIWVPKIKTVRILFSRVRITYGYNKTTLWEKSKQN